jgi:hypothetical protein
MGPGLVGNGSGADTGPVANGSGLLGNGSGADTGPVANGVRPARNARGAGTEARPYSGVSAGSLFPTRRRQTR